MDTITKRMTRRLIKALESGEYRKTRYALCNKRGDAFCCLGVLADIQGAEWETSIENRLFPIGNRQNEAMLEYKWAAGLSGGTMTKLARLNDGSRTFKPVIKYLKEEILPNAK